MSYTLLVDTETHHVEYRESSALDFRFAGVAAFWFFDVPGRLRGCILDIGGVGTIPVIIHPSTGRKPEISCGTDIEHGRACAD